MATTTIKIGHTKDDLSMIEFVLSPKPPFRTPHGISSQEYVVNVDFPSGNDILFEIEGSDKIRYAAFTTANGTVITYTEANLSSPRMGKSLALSARTANFKSLIIFNT